MASFEAEKARRSRIREWLREQKDKLKCVFCGEDDPACLDFHHRNPAEKDIAVSHTVARKWSIKKIVEEMEKCMVLCANCHRKEHSRA